jgi:beta-glucosidase
MNNKPLLLSCLISSLLTFGCYQPEPESTQPAKTAEATSQLPYFADWPKIESAIAKDPVIEAEVARLLSLMTLEEKVGQMVQPDLREVTPEEAGQYKLGSILNGGGSWPQNNKYATAEDWAKEADKYYLAIKEAYQDRGFYIPFMWATDAVHGHNNVFRATVFPHNIGLGAANNPELIKQIGIATAKEVVATGLDWTFAPTVAAPRNDRWGRTYEGYSEDPEIIYLYAAKMVEGLQGGASGLKGQANVISNVKHWVGDGGTRNGVDRGENHYSEEYLRNIHATGYFSGLNAGAQVVMTSFNSWHNKANYDLTGSGEYNKKLHGSKYLITDVLKNQMGFDGIVVTDWSGISEINGCTASDCAESVNAGNDVFMVPARSDWQGFYRNVINQVNSGIIPMSRIDDAVTRILRVKLRANLWDKPQPSQRQHAGDQSLLGAPEHRALARQAVSESLVLLKNNNILPLAKNQKLFIGGSAIHDIQKQTGGWSLTWQGTENKIDRDFPGATTMQMALAHVVGEENIMTDLTQVDKNSVVIMVIGEDPYAETFGDIRPNKTLEYATLKSTYGADLETIKTLHAAGAKIVTVFYSGRPLYVNEELNLSDAFVAAWLPGTEAGGITDVLFNLDGKDFTGKLSFSWPMTKCSTAINRVAPNLPNYVTPEMEQTLTGKHAPLFPYGYGLSYADGSAQVATDLNAIPLDPRDYGCGQTPADKVNSVDSHEIFGSKASGEFNSRIATASNNWQPLAVSAGSTTSNGAITTKPINYLHQQDALNVVFNGSAAAQLFLHTVSDNSVDFSNYAKTDATMQFDIDMKSKAPASLRLATQCIWPCNASLPLQKLMPEPSETADWKTIKVPLSCFVEKGMDFSQLNIPFLITSDEAVEFNIGEIRYVPRSLDPAEDAIKCESFIE